MVLIAGPRFGTRLALLLSLVLMSCLVVDDAQIPEEGNLPPSIVTGETARTMGVGLGQIIQIDLAEFEGGSELSIPVVVRDPNLEQALEYNAYVDFESENDIGALVAGGTIPANGELERPFVLQVPITELPTGCRRIELLVSSRFLRESAFRTPADPVDIARAVWWVRSKDETDPVVDMDTCVSF